MTAINSRTSTQSKEMTNTTSINPGPKSSLKKGATATDNNAT